MDPEDKDYVCTLDEYTLEKAKQELFEDPKQRLGAVQTLRKWIKSQPHLTSRTDTLYLLHVLRTAKFSQLRARELIETILTMRTKCPQYMVNLDTHEKGIQAYIDKGQMIPLPKRDKEGRTIILLRIGAIDLNDPLMSVANEMRASLSVQELGKYIDEGSVVHGVHLIFDCTGMTMKHIMRQTREEQKNTTKIYQDCNTGRVKGFHFYNCGTLFEVLMGIMKPLLKKKYTERLHVHDTMESLYKVFPMEHWPDEYLPDDYKGPSAGSMKSLCDNLKKQMMEPAFRAKQLDYTHERYKIDLSKKDNAVPQESFRKLNMD
jgi:hypothetical protein